jgi:UDP-N-acetylglucosamine--N-acetylmuramyl-(pentapeptide) pyrophosphoryl-undecaprenol N-acetylglucosamine transferase
MRLLLCGGGTGGHLFPAVAVAEEWLAGGGEVLFVGSGRATEREVLGRLGYPWRGINVAGFQGRGLRGKLSLARLPGALVQSLSIIREFRPDVVLGVGGYSAGPVIVAAKLLGLPCAVQEQNAVPGLTNRLLGRLARVAFVSFPDTERFFPGKAVLAGNPVRRTLLEAGLEARPATRPEGKPGLLIFGGSLGAHSINVAASAMLAHLRDMKEGLSIIHQTGAQDLAEVSAAYREAGFEAQVLPFIHDMAAAYGAADLVVCRAGATTLAELAALGKPSLLVPYPHATNNHQELNARAFERAGAAEVMLDRDMTPGRLAGRIRALLGDAPGRARMSEAAKGLARPEAAKRIASELRRLAQQ